MVMSDGEDCCRQVLAGRIRFAPTQLAAVGWLSLEVLLWVGPVAPVALLPPAPEENDAWGS